MPDLIFEIGTEEIPAGYIPPALDALGKSLAEFFKKNRLQAGSPKTLGTPRRLVVYVPDIEARQKDVVETHQGPNVKVAYDADGNPTKAAIGFARGKGVPVEDLIREKTAKGEVIAARVEQIGQPTDQILNDY